MIDLLVVNYNTKPLLERLLNTLHEDAGRNNPWAIYIADNDSTDDSRDFLRQHAIHYEMGAAKPRSFGSAMYSAYDLKEVHFLPNNGYSFAINHMAARGEGDIIGILNADVWLTSGDVAAIQSIFDEDPTISILGPKQRNEQGNIVHAGIVGTNEAPRHRGWNEHDPHDVKYKDQIDCVTVSGSAYFVRRSVWEDMTNHPDYKMVSNNAPGAFLPTPHYFEETWCSYFARHLGYRVVYDGTVSIGHTWCASTNGPAPILNQYFRESQKIFRAACDKIGIEHD